MCVSVMYNGLLLGGALGIFKVGEESDGRGCVLRLYLVCTSVLWRISSALRVIECICVVRVRKNELSH